MITYTNKYNKIHEKITQFWLVKMNAGFRKFNVEEVTNQTEQFLELFSRT